MFEGNFLGAPKEGHRSNHASPVTKELLLLTPLLHQRVERVLRLQYENIHQANQLLGEVKGHLAFRKTVASHVGLDRHYHLLNAKEAELSQFIAKMKHYSRSKDK